MPTRQEMLESIACDLSDIAKEQKEMRLKYGTQKAYDMPYYVSLESLADWFGKKKS
jgi:hypothetical protein